MSRGIPRTRGALPSECAIHEERHSLTSLPRHANYHCANTSFFVDRYDVGNGYYMEAPLSVRSFVRRVRPFLVARDSAVLPALSCASTSAP